MSNVLLWCLLTAQAPIIGPLRITGTPTAIVEVVGPEAAVRLQKTDNTPETEVYVAAFSPDRLGQNRKLGAMSFLFADPDASSGFASWNVHLTTLVDGLGSDDFAVAAWAGRGVTVFPYAIGAGFAPGYRTFHVNGDARVFGTMRVEGGFTAPEVTTLQQQVYLLLQRVIALEAKQP